LITDGTDPRTAAALLGHSSPALVMNIYANPQEVAKKKAMNRLDRHFNPDQQ
jgi:integrase